MTALASSPLQTSMRYLTFSLLSLLSRPLFASFPRCHLPLSYFLFVSRNFYFFFLPFSFYIREISFLKTSHLLITCRESHYPPPHKSNTNSIVITMPSIDTQTHNTCEIRHCPNLDPHIPLIQLNYSSLSSIPWAILHIILHIILHLIYLPFISASTSKQQ